MWSVPELTTGKFGNYDAGMDQFFFSVVFHSYIIRDCGSNLYVGMRVVEMF